MEFPLKTGNCFAYSTLTLGKLLSSSLGNNKKENKDEEQKVRLIHHYIACLYLLVGSGGSFVEKYFTNAPFYL